MCEVPVFGCRDSIPMKKETAEPSSDENWLWDRLRAEGVSIFELQGYIVNDDGVELCIDRRRVDDVRGWTKGRAWRSYLDHVSMESISAKISFAETAGCPYYVALYDDFQVRVYEFYRSGLRAVEGLMDIEEFGEWLFSQSDTTEVDVYRHRDDLPDFDAKLRENDTPWPSNIDGLWWDDDTVKALIEFQTTRKACVLNHSNNRWFKKDYARWRVLDKLQQVVQRPLVILTWSPNETDVKIKWLDEVVYDGVDRGLQYDCCRFTNKENVTEVFRESYDCVR